MEHVKPIVHVTEDLGSTAGPLVADGLRTAAGARGRARLAIPGGSTPEPVFRWLADNLDDDIVQKLVLTWVDERHVPPYPNDWRLWSADSSARLAWESWLSHLDRPPRTLPMHHAGSLAALASTYEQRFDAELGGLDVSLLGVGGDGHIASLFPDHPALGAAGTCVAVTDSPKPPPERLSLTLRTLAAAERTVVVARGAAKASVFGRVYSGDTTLPLGRLRPGGAVHWVLDPAAASALPAAAIRSL